MGGEGGGERFAALQMAVLDQLVERQVEAARHVAAFQARPRLGRAALEAVGGAGVHDLRRAGRRAPS